MLMGMHYNSFLLNGLKMIDFFNSAPFGEKPWKKIAGTLTKYLLKE